MRVLIIGGTALIGPHVIRELFANGIRDVHTITRSGKQYYCETSHAVNRCNQNSLQAAIGAINPDVLVDMIPFTADDANHVVASLTHLNLNIPVVALSSIDVYAAYACLHRTEEQEVQICPLTETMAVRQKPGPEGIAYDKLSVESIFNAGLNNICILRLPAIYGWPESTRVSHYLDQMLDGKREIEMSETLSNWKFSRCFHKNAAHAIVIAIQANQSGKRTYNVADEKTYTECQWVEQIAALCGWNGQIIRTNDSQNTTNWLQDFYVSTKRIRSELGYTDKYSTTEGLADTIAFHTYQRRGVTYQKYY